MSIITEPFEAEIEALRELVDSLWPKAKRWDELARRARRAGTSRTFDAYREHWQVTLPGPHSNITDAIDGVLDCAGDKL